MIEQPKMDAAFSAWAEKRGVWPRLTHQEIFAAGWAACMKHTRETESIQLVACPSCNHEFEAEINLYE